MLMLYSHFLRYTLLGHTKKKVGQRISLFKNGASKQFIYLFFKRFFLGKRATIFFLRQKFLVIHNKKKLVDVGQSLEGKFQKKNW